MFIVPRAGTKLSSRLLQPLFEERERQVVQLQKQLPVIVSEKTELQASLKKREGQCVLKHDEFMCMSLCQVFIKHLKIYCCADALEMQRRMSRGKAAQIEQLEREHLIIYS